MPDERIDDDRLAELIAEWRTALDINRKAPLERWCSEMSRDRWLAFNSETVDALAELQSRRQSEREAMVGAEEMASKLAERVYDCSDRLRAYEVPDVKAVAIEFVAPLYARLARQAALLGECREYVGAFQAMNVESCDLLKRIDAELGAKGGE